MASFATARSIFRSNSARSAAARLASQAKTKAAPASSPAPFGFSAKKPLSLATLRSPVEMSFCVESMLPYHTATASALLTSMLSISLRGYGWLPEGIMLNGY